MSGAPQRGQREVAVSFPYLPISVTTLVSTPRSLSGSALSSSAETTPLRGVDARIAHRRRWRPSGCWDAVNINIHMVRLGAAAPYFYEGRRGKYANRLEALAKQARAKKLGLWGACPRTMYDPYHGVETRR